MLDMGADQFVGMVGALEPDGLGTMGPDVMVDMLDAMDPTHFENLSGEQTFAMVDTMGFDTMIDMPPEKVLGVATGLDM